MHVSLVIGALAAILTVLINVEAKAQGSTLDELIAEERKITDKEEAAVRIRAYPGVWSERRIRLREKGINLYIENDGVRTEAPSVTIGVK